jgi:RNA polymerase sigma-70 factor (ECF subfamily)
VTLEQLLAALDLDRRAAFVLTQLVGYSYAEAAQACGVPIGTIRSRVARAREVLVALLDDPAAVAV